MKSWIIIAGLFFSGAACAQYDFLRYRNSDPFVFCTEGMKLTKPPCWVPLAPYRGQFMYTGLCEPNPYGRAWDAADVDALRQLVTVCPMTSNSGGWNGVGPANTSPSVH